MVDETRMLLPCQVHSYLEMDCFFLKNRPKFLQIKNFIKWHVAFHQEYLGIEQPAIGQLIRALRQTLKLTQAKFAAQLGVSFPTINRWENGHATPSPLALRQIETLLKQLSQSPDATLQKRAQALQRQYFPAGELNA